MLHLSESGPATFQLLAVLVGETLRSQIHYVFNASMPMVSQMQHPQSLNFTNQKKAYILRKVEKLPFRKIAKEARNLQKRRSTEDNLSLLTTDDFVANPENVRVLCFKGRPGDVTPSDRIEL